MSSSGESGGTGGSKAGRWLTALAVIALVTGGALLFSYGLTSRRESAQPTEEPSFGRYEAAWSSAMAKAGVEATFPPEPVDLSDLRASGRRSFEATFTAEEISALLTVYRFETEIEGMQVEIGEADVSFPSAGVAAIDGRLISGSTGYRMKAEAPLIYSATGIRTKGLTSLNVEGFTVGGAKRKQAGKAIVGYLNEMLDEAPGLTVRSASIVEGGVRVSGWAPVRLDATAGTGREDVPDAKTVRE